MKGEPTMSETTAGQAVADARELWKQWGDTTAHIWETILGGSKAPYTDPYGIYDTWLKAMHEFQEQMQKQAKVSSTPLSQAIELWKQWFERAARLWSGATDSMQAAQSVSTTPQSMYQVWLKSIELFQEQMQNMCKTLPNPQEAWKQWLERTAAAWNDAFGPNKGPIMALYTLYQAWLKTMGELQEQMKANPLIIPDAKEAWSRWFTYVTDAWSKAVEGGADPLGLTTQWLEMLEEARANLEFKGVFPADPFTLYKQWYDATSESWAKIVEQAIGTEQFMQAAHRFLESYSSFTGTFRRANEEYFHNLQLPTRSDIARVASLVVEVEDKVDLLQDAFDDFTDSAAIADRGKALQHLDKRMQSVEHHLDALQAAAASSNVTASLAHLEQRLDLVESKLDHFLHLLEKIEERTGADKASGARRKGARASASPARNNGVAAEVMSSMPSEEI
jgi:phage shock protein A